LKILRQQAEVNINLFVERELPHETELLLENTNALLRTAWAALDKDVKEGKPPYSGTESILQIMHEKREHSRS
jgi:hypothetical protein